MYPFTYIYVLMISNNLVGLFFFGDINNFAINKFEVKLSLWSIWLIVLLGDERKTDLRKAFSF